MLRRGTPIFWSPVGLSDTLDSTVVFNGAMSLLQNLIPDPTTTNIWTPRPASLKQTAFAGFTTPGFISGFIVIGTRAYGMIATGLTAGYDQPFCFDLVAQAFVTITGVTGSNVPLSPATTGAWTPPTFALVGVKLVVTHPGFDGITNFFGHLDISNPASLAWGAGNTATNALPSVPVAVAQFFDRAYYLCNPVGTTPGALATDVLDPLTRTNGTYALTFGDIEPLTALAGLPLSNQLGGIVQSLIVFKGTSNMYQITGDFILNNTTVNALNVATGTAAPRSICPTPVGLMFMAPDGIRVIGFDASVSPPIGAAGAGVVQPFTNAVVPSRVAAACNASVLRVSVQNGVANGSPMQEYWYDVVRKVWSGPHTFPASCIGVYAGQFIIAPSGVTASLWSTTSSPISTSTYVENGAQLQWAYRTALLPDRKNLNQCVMSRTSLYLGAGLLTGSVFVAAEDQSQNVIESVTLNFDSSLSTWDAFTWGEALWGGVATPLAANDISWPDQINFDRVALYVTGASAAGLRVGALDMLYQPLKYAAHA